MKCLRMVFDDLRIKDLTCWPGNKNIASINVAKANRVSLRKAKRKMQKMRMSWFMFCLNLNTALCPVQKEVRDFHLVKYVSNCLSRRCTRTGLSECAASLR